MARYIKSNILFQSYVHIEAPYKKLQEKEKQIETKLQDFVTERAQHFLYPDVDIDLEFKEGSIKAYATVRGSLKDCLNGDYIDFHSEIENLYWFAKRMSDAANMEVAFLTGSFLRSIERTEARPGIIGQTKRILDSILAFRTTDSEKSAAALIRNVRSTRIDAGKLIKNLVDAGDKTMVKKEFSELLNSAPKRISPQNKVSDKLELSYSTALTELKNSVK